MAHHIYTWRGKCRCTSCYILNLQLEQGVGRKLVTKYSVKLVNNERLSQTTRDRNVDFFNEPYFFTGVVCELTFGIGS